MSISKRKALSIVQQAASTLVSKGDASEAEAARLIERYGDDLAGGVERFYGRLSRWQEDDRPKPGDLLLTRDNGYMEAWVFLRTEEHPRLLRKVAVIRNKSGRPCVYLWDIKKGAIKGRPAPMLSGDNLFDARDGDATSRLTGCLASLGYPIKLGSIVWLKLKDGRCVTSPSKIDPEVYRVGDYVYRPPSNMLYVVVKAHGDYTYDILPLGSVNRAVKSLPVVVEEEPGALLAKASVKKPLDAVVKAPAWRRLVLRHLDEKAFVESDPTDGPKVIRNMEVSVRDAFRAGILAEPLEKKSHPQGLEALRVAMDEGQESLNAFLRSLGIRGGEELSDAAAIELDASGLKWREKVNAWDLPVGVPSFYEVVSVPITVPIPAFMAGYRARGFKAPKDKFDTSRVALAFPRGKGMRKAWVTQIGHRYEGNSTYRKVLREVLSRLAPDVNWKVSKGEDGYDRISGSPRRLARETLFKVYPRTIFPKESVRGTTLTWDDVCARNAHIPPTLLRLADSAAGVLPPVPRLGERSDITALGERYENPVQIERAFRAVLNELGPGIRWSVFQPDPDEVGYTVKEGEPLYVVRGIPPKKMALETAWNVLSSLAPELSYNDAISDDGRLEMQGLDLTKVNIPESHLILADSAAGFRRPRSPLLRPLSEPVRSCAARPPLHRLDIPPEEVVVYHNKRQGTVARGNTPAVKEILGAKKRGGWGFSFMPAIVQGDEEYWCYPASIGRKESPIDVDKLQQVIDDKLQTLRAEEIEADDDASFERMMEERRKAAAAWMEEQGMDDIEVDEAMPMA